MSSSKQQKVNDTAGAQMWADEVTDLVRRAKSATARSKNNLQYHRDRVNDEKKAREDLLNEYAHLRKIEENCFGGRRIVPRYNASGDCCTCGSTMANGGTEGGICALHGRQPPEGSGEEKTRTRERNLPELPMSARGVQAAKYRLRERAERKRFKEEQVMLAREAEKRLRKERLRAAKNRFADDGHVPNVLATFERDLQLQFGNEGGVMSSPRMTKIKMMASSLDFAGGGQQTPNAVSPRGKDTPKQQAEYGEQQTNTKSLKANDTNNKNHENPSSRTHLASPQEQKMIITATILATSGLPPDVLKAGAASVKNLAAATQLLLLTRQHLAILADTVVRPNGAAVEKCYSTRLQSMPEGERGYHDAVEKAFLKAISGANKHERSLDEERVRLEDMVAYLEGLRKAIAGRLPKALTASTAASGSSSSSPRANATEASAPSAPFVPPEPLPQVKAEQPQPPSVVNVVALATGKRRRVPVQDTQAAIAAADHAYPEAIAVNDSALSLRRSVAKDIGSLMEGLLAALDAKVSENRKLQRALTEQIGVLGKQLKELDGFLSRHRSEKGNTVVTEASQTTTTTAMEISPTRGAGVVVPPTEQAIKHVREDREKASKLLEELSANLRSKRALEVVDTEIINVLKAVMEKEKRGVFRQRREVARSNNHNEKQNNDDESPSQRERDGGGQRRIPLPPPNTHQRFSPKSKDPSSRYNFDGSGSARGSYSYGNLDNKEAYTPQLPSVGGAVTPRPPAQHHGQSTASTGSSSLRDTARSSSGREQGRSVAANFGTDVDDLISARGAVSTRSAKVKAASTTSRAALLEQQQQRPAHLHHYHQQILYHDLKMPSEK